MKKDCVAMILAGGQGSRLGALTKGVAKPAVQFGAKYRIIDFVLTNCAHSGLDTVGVLTQYKPLLLNTYISSGKSWDLDRLNGGVYVLPPYMQEEAGEWYKGTANAIYQNIEFIEQFQPENVLVLSGDHIYKMDYSKMIKLHNDNDADVTIAHIPVEPREASRFGILSFDETGRITGFEEKPKVPKSNYASMGIYVFKWKELKAQLIADEKDPQSSNDFGKNIIPHMLNTGKRVFGYGFKGYWKDVGTIYSLWQAHMDMLDDDELELYDDEWPIFSKSALKPPHYVGKNAHILDSFVTEGCYIDGTVRHSVISDGVTIGKGAEVTDSIIMTDVKVGENVKLNKVIIGHGAAIGNGAQIGTEEETTKYKSVYCSDGVTLIAGGITICENAVVGGNCMVSADIKEEK